MSLLLDALKKAADEKNKNESAARDPESTDQNDNALQLSDDLVSEENKIEDESLELELEFEPETVEENSTTSAPAEDFPEVDENALLQKEEAEVEPENSTLQNNELEADQTEDLPAESIESKTTETAINETELVSETAKDKPEPETAAEPVLEIKEPAPKATDNLKATQKSRIENEQALSALINKSNQHSRKEKLKRNISIAVLITLILIGSGLYFYIQMETASQDLFIASNQTAAVNRQIEKPVLQQPPVQQTIAPAVQAPTQKQNRVIAPAAKPVKKAVRKTTAPTKSINIIHTKKADPIHILLRDAYNAFQHEDYLKSEKLYTKALNREPRNRDALLGLAAIGTKQQRYEYARQKYMYLLKLNPRDTIATAGISSIESQVDPDLTESQLKFMLRQQPDAAHLYFALGGQYLAQEKWAEAQSAYFSAWSAENTNADYAYNLAVSLDHLDKKQQAVDFYKLSIKLKNASGGNFSKGDTQDRINTLQEKAE